MKQLELKKLIKKAQLYSEKRIRLFEHSTTPHIQTLVTYHRAKVDAYQEVLLAMDNIELSLFHAGIMDQDKDVLIDTLIQGRG